jgi:uncharacterized protein
MPTPHGNGRGLTVCYCRLLVAKRQPPHGLHSDPKVCFVSSESTPHQTTAQSVAELLDLKPLGVEGGLFAQTWRAESGEARPAGTAIYALFTDEPDSFSALHRLDATEVWHHYLGDPLHVVLLHADGTHEVRVLGTDLLHGERPQLIIEAGTWMGAFVPSPGEYTLIGCTMAPGFVGSAYEGGVQADLLATHPAAVELITRLTRPGFELGTPPES